MRRDPRAFLWDVREAADAIAIFTDGFDAARYRNEPLVRSAVERQFEIIGEALNRLAKNDPELAAQVPHLREIVSFRNVLIHGYAAVDHTRVWRIRETELPALREAVAALLSTLDAPD